MIVIDCSNETQTASGRLSVKKCDFAIENDVESEWTLNSVWFGDVASFGVNDRDHVGLLETRNEDNC